MMISLIALLASCDDTEFASHGVVVEGEGIEAVREIFDGNCTSGCHSGDSPSAGLNLEDDPCDATIGVEGSTGDDLVVAGSAEDSLLWQRIAGVTSTVMPPSGGMDQANIDIIGDWIDDGAPCDEADADADTDADSDYDWPDDSQLEPVYNQAFGTCKGCHGENNPSGDISLTEDTLIDSLTNNGPNEGESWIVPYESGNSRVLQKMNAAWEGDGDPMPPTETEEFPDGGSSEANVTTVRDWIDAGAQE